MLIISVQSNNHLLSIFFNGQETILSSENAEVSKTQPFLSTPIKKVTFHGNADMATHNNNNHKIVREYKQNAFGLCKSEQPIHIGDQVRLCQLNFEVQLLVAGQRAEY